MYVSMPLLVVLGVLAGVGSVWTLAKLLPFVWENLGEILGFIIGVVIDTLSS